MQKKVVLVVDGISKKTKEMSLVHITKEAQVIFSDGDNDVIKQYLPKASVLVTSTKGISPDMLKAAFSCVFIQKFGAGTNNIDITQASQRNIPVANVPATNSRSVAETALTMMLAVYKQVIKGHNELVQNGKWLKTVLRDNNHELTGKTVGIVGFGNIGRHLRCLLTGFNCRVIYFDEFRLNPDQETELNIEFMNLDDLIRISDIITLHCPLLDSTKHLINAKLLNIMKPEAVLINCARGGIVDEQALYHALSNKKILGAGIDTFETEPIDNTHPFCTLTNVVLGPHNGGGTVEAIEAVVFGAACNINSMLLEGSLKCPSYVVNANDIDMTQFKASGIS